MPGVELALDLVALGQQGAVARSQIVDHLLRTGPERGGIYAGAGQCLVLDEVVENPGHLEPADLNPLCHLLPHFREPGGKGRDPYYPPVVGCFSRAEGVAADWRKRALADGGRPL